MVQEKSYGSFADRVMTPGNSPIHFILCRDRQGHIAHYFLKTTPDKLKLLRKKKGDIPRPEEYGTVIACGFGYLPSETVRRRMLSDYAYDFNTLCVDYIRHYEQRA